MKFKKDITRVFEGYQLVGALTREDGTEVEGSLSMSEENDVAVFDPGATLDPNTRYLFKLYKLPESGSESGQAGGTQGGSGGGTGGIIGGPEAEGLSPVGTRDLEMEPLLELQFETGQYGTFVEMLRFYHLLSRHPEHRGARILERHPRRSEPRNPLRECGRQRNR
ncbi:MAG: hypothetical protein JRH06_11880 [Deltaproteobacteria bacterium]|nr:hypothetical protein [Deltaproteobacteria bacterium]